MERKTKEEKAITLIALIITIVVLLILAVVAINAVTGDGIIQHATNAKTEYEKAQAEENKMLSYYETYLKVNGQVGKWVQNKTKLTKLNSDGTVSELEVGDLIENYESATNTEIEWKVLGAENGNILLVSASNVTTKLLNKGRDEYLNDAAIKEINAIGAEYDNGTGAVDGSGRSITVKDIDRITGYNPLKTGTGEIYYYPTHGRVTQYLNKVTFTLREDTEDFDDDLNTTEDRIYYQSELEPEAASSEYQTFTNIDGKVLVKESDTEDEGKTKSVVVQNNFYRYYPTSLTQDRDNTTINGISEDSEAYKLLFVDTDQDGISYWLGSSYSAAYAGNAFWGLFCVYRCRVENIGLWNSNDGAFAPVHGVRAVITLKSNVQFTSSGTNAYTISVPNE